MRMSERHVIVSGLLLTAVAPAFAADAPTATVRPAARFTLPGVQREGKASGYVDCNSPAHWDGQTLYVFSSDGGPWRCSGPDLMHLERKSEKTQYDTQVNGGRWIEATHK